jgi:hypothetical protein
MAQQLVMIIVDDGGSLREHMEQWVKDDLEILRGSFDKYSSEKIVTLTSPDHTTQELDAIADAIAEMQEEIAENKE